MKNHTTAADMKLMDRIMRCEAPEELPISFCYGERLVRGIPADFSPEVETRWTDACMLQRIFRGRNVDGLEIRVEYTEYLDYAGTEFLAFLTNFGTRDTPVISDLRIVDGILAVPGAALCHGNGDTCDENGYGWTDERVDHAIVKETADGTSCNGAFPYMRLHNGTFGVNVAVGWPASWKAEFSPAGCGVRLSVSQKNLRTVIRPGETLRTPRVNLLAYAGDEQRGANVWRRWYMAHILPRENGRPLAPKWCLHVFMADGYPEFTGATLQNQCEGLRDYLARKLRPDIWWVDAGWYPCRYEWSCTGNWRVDPERFPQGMGELGRLCEENGTRLLLWFEPERARLDSALAAEHPEWMLYLSDENGGRRSDCLVDLGNDECCRYMIELIDGIIKDSHVHIYRQDFNFSPRAYWEAADEPKREGARENHHVQGYLRLWDTLRLRNPGLWIDSCTGGGRRNDLETMRRAVPLHYTDIGYGNHPIKQKQHFQMHQWIPYFRAHNMNWDDPKTGEYGQRNHAPDRFSYHCAMAPAMTDMIKHDASEDAFELAREMQGIWRKAAELMLGGDYYPLTVCRKSAGDYYAAEFYDPDEERGYLQVIRNNRAAQPSFTARLKAVDKDARYVLWDPERGERFERTGGQLLEGLPVEIPVRSGKIYFFEKLRSE